MLEGLLLGVSGEVLELPPGALGLVGSVLPESLDWPGVSDWPGVLGWGSVDWPGSPESPGSPPGLVEVEVARESWTYLVVFLKLAASAPL